MNANVLLMLLAGSFLIFVVFAPLVGKGVAWAGPRLADLLSSYIDNYMMNEGLKGFFSKSLFTGIAIGILLASLITGKIPIPIPTPVPPTPDFGDDIYVLLVEDTQSRETYSPAQLDVLLSREDGSLRHIVETKGGKLRLIDDSTLTQLDKDEPWVREAAKQVDKSKLPFIVATDGKNWFAEKIGDDTLPHFQTLTDE